MYVFLQTSKVNNNSPIYLENCQVKNILLRKPVFFSMYVKILLSKLVFFKDNTLYFPKMSLHKD